MKKLNLNINLSNKVFYTFIALVAVIVLGVGVLATVPAGVAGHDASNVYFSDGTTLESHLGSLGGTGGSSGWTLSGTNVVTTHGLVSEKFAVWDDTEGAQLGLYDHTGSEVWFIDNVPDRMRIHRSNKGVALEILNSDLSVHVASSITAGGAITGTSISSIGDIAGRSVTVGAGGISSSATIHSDYALTAPILIVSGGASISGPLQIKTTSNSLGESCTSSSIGTIHYNTIDKDVCVCILKSDGKYGFWGLRRDVIC